MKYILDVERQRSGQHHPPQCKLTKSDERKSDNRIEVLTGEWALVWTEQMAWINDDMAQPGEGKHTLTVYLHNLS